MDPTRHDWLDPWVPQVARWCARLGGPWVHPEDAAQEVLVVAMNRRHALRDEGAVEAWLFGITRRVLARHRRRAWWKRMTPILAPRHAAGAPTPETAASLSQDVQQLIAALETLPTTQREALVLSAVEGLPIHAVARMQGVPEGTVKSRIRLARARLRAHLLEEP